LQRGYKPWHSEPLYPYAPLHNQQPLPSFEEWICLHVPGHSYDSVCFYHEASGSLISGDTLMGSRRRKQLVSPDVYTHPYHLLYSLKKLKALAPEHVYPGHGDSFHGTELLANL